MDNEIKPFWSWITCRDESFTWNISNLGQFWVHVDLNIQYSIASKSSVLLFLSIFSPLCFCFSPQRGSSVQENIWAGSHRSSQGAEISWAASFHFCSITFKSAFLHIFIISHLFFWQDKTKSRSNLCEPEPSRSLS